LSWKTKGEGQPRVWEEWAILPSRVRHPPVWFCLHLTGEVRFVVP